MFVDPAGTGGKADGRPEHTAGTLQPASVALPEKLGQYQLLPQ